METPIYHPDYMSHLIHIDQVAAPSRQAVTSHRSRLLPKPQVQGGKVDIDRWMDGWMNGWRDR